MNSCWPARASYGCLFAQCKVEGCKNRRSLFSRHFCRFHCQVVWCICSGALPKPHAAAWAAEAPAERWNAARAICKMLPGPGAGCCQSQLPYAAKASSRMLPRPIEPRGDTKGSCNACSAGECCRFWVADPISPKGL